MTGSQVSFICFGVTLANGRRPGAAYTASVRRGWTTAPSVVPVGSVSLGAFGSFAFVVEATSCVRSTSAAAPLLAVVAARRQAGHEEGGDREHGRSAAHARTRPGGVAGDS